MKKFLFISLMLLIAVPMIAIPALAIEMSDITFGGQVRLRGYNIQNVWDFDDDNNSDNWSVFRLKSSLSASVDTGSNVTGLVKITNQNWGEGVSDAAENLSNKFFVDNAYINVAKFLDTPISLKFGRQDLMYGSGFVLFDGQSQSGSTSTYFDGVKASWQVTEKSVLDALYFKDNENTRDNTTDDDITLAGAYFTTHCPAIGGKQEIYALNRKDDVIEKNIWMYGLRLSDTFDYGLNYSAEVAMQTGDADEANEMDHNALGYKLDLGYKLKNVATTPKFFIGYTSLSGDDSSTTDEYEGWDVFYGGWPQFGDLLAFKYLNVPPNNLSNPTSSTTGEAAYTNLDMATIGVSADLLENLSTTLSYSMLTFNETTGDDDFGTYYQLKAKYKYSKNMSFSLYAAMIQPGDAFTGEDDASEIFWETNLSF